jgi:hypothetical protein
VTSPIRRRDNYMDIKKESGDNLEASEHVVPQVP